MLGLYIHIPFCSHICSYCDFVKQIATNETKRHYVTTLIAELHTLGDTLKDVETVYIGGGTPSSLPLDDLCRLLQTIDGVVDSGKVKEFTIEINPEDVSLALIERLQRSSINRLSLGVQSFNDTTLQRMGRAHTAEEAIAAIHLLKEHGFHNISLDLIFGYPTQTIKTIKADLKQAIELDVPHLSPYALILEDNTILNHLIKENEERIIDDDTVSMMYTIIRDICQSNGLNHYEISNFSKAGFESLHNTLYWTDQPYIGIGAGAHSYIDQKRFSNTRNVTEYIHAKPPFKSIKTTEETQPLNDACMMGLRRLEGINIPLLNNRYKTNIMSRFPQIDSLINMGILSYKEPFLKLTEKGLLLANEAFMIFLED